MSHIFSTTSTPQTFGGFVLACCIFLLPNIVQAGTTNTVTVQWAANQEADLAGYKVYHGKSPGIYGSPLKVSKTTTTVPYANLESNKTHYFSVSAYDLSGNESSPSLEVSNFIPGQISVTEPPSLVSPPLGSTLTSSTMTFQWSAGSGVDEYWLYVGTTPGGKDIYDQSQGTSTSASVSGIMLNGNPAYARLYWRIGGGTWSSTDYTYQTQGGGGGGDPAITSPTPGSTLTASPATFQWSTGSGVDEYWLGVGTSQAAVANTPWGNIFAESVGTKTSQFVSAIPLTGKPVFVRLWWRIGTTWSYTDSTYQTQKDDSTPSLVSPSADSTLTTSTATFQWSAGHAVEKYYLGVGTSQAAVANTPWGNIFAESVGTKTSQFVSAIPLTGKPVFVRLWWKRGTTWLFTDYTYHTQRDDSTPWMVSPSADSMLTTSTATFEWSAGHAVEKYYLSVGTSQAAIANTPWGDIFAQSTGTNTTQVVADIPLTGKPVFVRLWWKRGTTWLFTDYTYQTPEVE